MVDILKRFIPQFLILAVICVIATCGYVKDVTVSGNNIETAKTVIIDPGHGGFDGGAVAGDGTVEKDINLNISLTLKGLLEFNGYNVIMTRSEDTSTDNTDKDTIAARKKSDLQNRLELMEQNPDAIYVSVHLNKFTTSSAIGAQVFYTTNYSAAAALAENIQSNIVKNLQPENQRVIKKGTSGTYLLHNAKVPAVIVECGFLSNTKELKNLKNTDYQSQMAFCIACGIFDFFSQNAQ